MCNVNVTQDGNNCSLSTDAENGGEEGEEDQGVFMFDLESRSNIFWIGEWVLDILF